MDERLYIIDAIAPFFLGIPEGKRINWSKIPFYNLENEDGLDKEKCRRITEAFRSYVGRVAAIGYTAISIDDVAHLAPLDFYPGRLKIKIAEYQAFFKELFSIADQAGLCVYLTTDIMFYNEYIRKHVKHKHPRILAVLRTAIETVFQTFPEVAGIITRIGESDGMDVTGDFRSRMTVKNPKTARKYIRTLIDIFERYDRLLIFRTWTVGAYRIGDLIWNLKTYHFVFDRIISRHLVVSLKYGTSDFFRFLKLNPLFFEGAHKKIIELQARREYEGFGEFPSYVGNDYAVYHKQLKNCKTLIGIMAWCQTGGWSHFNKLSFIDKEARFNEINAYVIIKIYKDGMPPDEALTAYARGNRLEPAPLIAFMKGSERVVKELWYLPEFSQRPLYFRRVRVPPVIWVFWDTIAINHTMRKILKRFVSDRMGAVRQGYQALTVIQDMKRLALKLNWDAAAMDYVYDTFHIMALAREYFVGQWRPDILSVIEKAAIKYENRYPRGFKILRDYRPVWVKKQIIGSLFKITLRDKPNYRLVDILFLIRFSGLVFTLLVLFKKKMVPEYARKHTMGIQFIFK